MTYKEAYMKCETFEEFEKMVKNDITVALMINKDRLFIINRVANEVTKEKGW